ncbi:MAG: phosphate signaling complex protein PhoU [Deltaproteobacteria bacterium]|nr:phosphate signaling complex protein PhoU [Deltaproteobacteria bacterium]
MGFTSLISKEIKKLKHNLLYMGGKVEHNFTRAVNSIENRDVELANKVINNDIEIDTMEVDIEEESLKILALHQPVAKDLRFIVTTLKVNNDLERIDDFCVHLAKHALFFADKPLFKMPFEFNKMASLVRTMLKESLDSLVELDQAKAIKVREKDDAVDDINKQMYKTALEIMRSNPDMIELQMHAVGISNSFERIADLSTNIAEDVIYLVSGQIVRH